MLIQSYHNHNQIDNSNCNPIWVILKLPLFILISIYDRGLTYVLFINNTRYKGQMSSNLPFP